MNDLWKKWDIRLVDYIDPRDRCVYTYDGGYQMPEPSTVQKIYYWCIEEIDNYYEQSMAYLGIDGTFYYVIMDICYEIANMSIYGAKSFASLLDMLPDYTQRLIQSVQQTACTELAYATKSGEFSKTLDYRKRLTERGGSRLNPSKNSSKNITQSNL